MFEYRYCYFPLKQPRSYQQFQKPVVDAVEGMLPYVVDFVVAHRKNMFGCISHNFNVQHQLSNGAVPLSGKLQLHQVNWKQ